MPFAAPLVAAFARVGRRESADKAVDSVIKLHKTKNDNDVKFAVLGKTGYSDTVDIIRRTIRRFCIKC